MRHPEEVKIYEKNRKRDLDIRAKANKKWRENHKEQNRKLQNAHKKIVRESWMVFLENRGLTKCFKCGYDKCFAAIDFHHINRQDKDIGIAVLMAKKLTEERTKELEKTIPLCANCHRELHFGAKEDI